MIVNVIRYALLSYRILLIASIGLGLVALFGVLIGDSEVRRFGRVGLVPPLVAIGYMAVAIALLIPLRFKTWVAATFLAIPILASALAILGIAIFPPRGIGGWKVEFVPPFFETLVCLPILTIAVALARHHGRAFSRVAAALASVTFCVSIMSGAALFLIGPAAGDIGKSLPSLPSTAQAIMISLAVLAWGGWPKWAEIPGRGRQQTKMLLYTLPIVVLLPALNSLVEVVVNERGGLSYLMVEVFSTAVNVAVLAALVFWTVTRLASEHATLWETTNAMDSAPIALTSVDGEILHWSRGCEELFGWTADQVVGRNKSEVLQSRDVVLANFGHNVGAAVDQQREVIELRSDGTPVHVLERARIVQAEGRPPVLVYKMTDISERVKMEAALKESDANLSLALNAQQIGTFDWDVASGLVVVDAGMEQRLGLQPGELTSLSGWTARIVPEDLDGVRATIEAAAANRAERYNFKYQMNVPNGGLRSLEGSGRLVYDAEGKLTKIVGVHVDVTNRNEREAALMAEQEQLRLVLKTVPTAMVIFDELGIIRAFSASAERLFGYTAEDAVGCNVEMLAVKPDNNQRAGTIIERYLAGGVSNVTDPTSITYARHRDGSAVPVELWMGDMHVGDKRLFTGFAEDLTERLTSERRLARMHDELLHASRLSTVGEMAAGLAHELNQPLAAATYFLGAADRILDDQANLEQGRSLLRLGGQEALRAGEIIRRMRDFSMLSGIDMQLGQLSTIIEDAVSLAFVGNARYEIRLVYDLDPAAERVLVDRVQIGQVFVNLLRNATEELRKCPADARSITISTREQDGDMVEVKVADSGPGLDPKIISELYMPFVSTKRDKGMGLGLSICRRIIKEHGGTFEAVNGDSGGAVFRFTLSKSPVMSEKLA
ncbi:pas pac sensor signal transduction histidine kinase [Novosphingobium sp. Rr 2-17]|nr:pas pac sensor signal transduction histidine kinase [Novosphingobium sp. Rr 2-17]